MKHLVRRSAQILRRRFRQNMLSVAAPMALLVLGGFVQAQTFAVLHNFSGVEGCGPLQGLSMDRGGRLYGTAYFNGAHGQGSVFKLANTVQGWVYSDLHDFDGTDGSLPTSSVLLGGNGKLYGTASGGGTSGCGVVWEIAP